jgi:hypothetical protein
LQCDDCNTQGASRGQSGLSSQQPVYGFGSCFDDRQNRQPSAVAVEVDAIVINVISAATARALRMVNSP